MARTTIAAVQALLGPNFGKNPDRSVPDLQQFVDSASAIVDDVATCAVDRDMARSAAQLELVERWLAAHFYAQMDQLYQSRSTGGATASFQGQTGMSLDSTRYGQSAVNLDYSGCLSAIGKRQFARGFWLGQDDCGTCSGC